MMDRKVIKDVLAQVTIAVLVQVVIYGLVYIYSYFNKEKINITVCSSTKNDLGYSTSVNIKNFQEDKSIDSIFIWSSANIDVNTINYGEFEVKGEKITIKNIPPSFDGTIIFYSNERITEENTKFETNEKRTVNFLYKQKQNISLYLQIFLVTIITNFIIYIVLNWISSQFFYKKIEKVKENLTHMEEENERIEKRLNFCERQSKKEYEAYLKLKIFLHRRIRDYAKELKFYKMLIKDIIHNDGKDEDICYQITKELKTFKTMEKINIEDLELDSLELSKNENKQIDSELSNYFKEADV